MAVLQPGEWHMGLIGRGDAHFEQHKSPSQAGITYVPAVGRYIMMQWYYNTMNTTEVDGNCGPWDPVADAAPWPGPATGPNFNNSDTTCVRHSRWSIYEAPKPWGPWNLVREIDQPGGANMGWYNPIVPNKFISGTPTYNATTGRWRVEAWAFTVGNFMDYPQTPAEGPNGWYTWANTRYTLYMVPISFYW